MQIDMKKLSIYITVLLAAALTACNEDLNEGVASPQSYGQEEATGKITFTATGVAPINIGNVEEESVAVAVFTAPAVEEEATLSYKMKLDNKVYLSLDSKFDWPSTSSSYYKEEGTCLGGKSQLAILSNGVVSICCLDSEGESNLGNIFTDSMEDIISSDKFKNTINGFNDNKVYLDICKHCSYKERFNKKNI